MATASVQMTKCYIDSC